MSCGTGHIVKRTLTGDLRWKRPLPAEKRNDTLVLDTNISGVGVACFQQLSSIRNYTMSEDCLLLNVYTPSEYWLSVERKSSQSSTRECRCCRNT